METLTKGQRLERYKLALEFMLHSRDRMWGHGLCYALSGGIGNSSKYYPCGETEIKEMYPEMWKRRPHRERDTFWWDQCSNRGYTTRIKVLISIINEMEGQNNGKEK